MRDRDSLAQERISIARAREHLLDRLAAPWSPPARGECRRRIEPAPGLDSYTQSHMATTPLFTPALASLGDLVPHEGLLSPDELEQSPSTIGERPRSGSRSPTSDPDHRRYELVYEDERMDAWVLSWMPGQATGFHDHYISGVGIAVAAGGVREDLLVYGGEDVALHLRTGDTRQGGPGYIHRVRHEDGRARGDDPRLLPAARLGRPVPARRRRHRPPRGAPGPERAHRAAHRRRARSSASSSGFELSLRSSTADPGDLGRPGGAFRPAGRLDRPRLLVHVLPPVGQPARWERTTSASSARSSSPVGGRASSATSATSRSAGSASGRARTTRSSDARR